MSNNQLKQLISLIEIRVPSLITLLNLFPNLNNFRLYLESNIILITKISNLY